MTESEHNDPGWVPLTRLIPHPENPTPATLRTWSLVLAARGIPYRTIPERKPHEILIPEQYSAIAVHEISLYRRENPDNTPPVKPLPTTENRIASISILLLLGIFHNLTYFHISGFGYNPIDWLNLGSANSSLIFTGEWWRIITALTLHADGQHLMGNILIGGYFVVRLCEITGSGMGWFLILGSGALGNLLNAFFQSGTHNAVGASTAIFGAIGIAGAISSTLSPRHLIRQWLLPLAAAAVLLGLLGTGTDSRTDVGAHLFGFLAGALLGIGAGLYLRNKGKLTDGRNLALAIITPAIVAAAWMLALLN
ncbi:MAG: rhomboid family intramembrane serine protease [Desulfuromonas sp.]|nr:MAG: rhomboid family intramembrane serine protease [Desulfuromonas sp.]